MFLTKKPAAFMPRTLIAALTPAFNETELDEISRLSTHLRLSAGTVLTTEGTPGRQALILGEGTASVFRNGVKIATIKPGEVIGEIALLSGEPRTATVIADSAVTVLAFSPREFATLMARCPGVAKRVASIAVRRLSEV